MHIYCSDVTNKAQTQSIDRLTPEAKLNRNKTENMTSFMNI